MRRARLALLAFVVCLPWALPGLAGAQAPQAEYARDPQVPVVTWREVPGEIADADAGVHLIVYGDGRAVAHYPRFMKRAGEYELRLSAAEMNALIRGLVSKGLVEFDRNATRRAARESARTSEIERDSSDPAITVIELRLSLYRPVGAPADVVGVHKRIEWVGLRSDAREHPSVRALQDLAAAQRDLAALAARAAEDTP